MVNFYFHFLIGFPSAHSRSEEEDTGSDVPKEPTETLKNSQGKSYVEYKADKPTFSCHIEYILAPEVQPKSVDIICWGRVAKIYVEEESAAVIPLSLGKICWIYFRLERMTTINNEDVNAYYNHNIPITVSLDVKKLGQLAKSDKVKVFYGSRYETDKLFPFLSEDPEDITSNRVSTANCKPVLSVDFESSDISNKLRKIIQNLTKEYESGDGRPTATGQKHPPWRIVKDSAEGDANGKTALSRSKGDLQSDMSFAITGESIFSGLKIIENYLKYKSEVLPYVYNAFELNNVLDIELAKHYNPLSVTLKHMKFMPVSVLEKENVRKVRFCYTVCEKYEAQSNDIEISENMTLHYTRTILTDSISTPELIEYIQTKGLTITLFGIREETGDEMVKVKPKMYKDQRINCKSGLPGVCPKNISVSKTDAVILGIAQVDISSILLEPHRLTVKYNFTYGESNREILQKSGYRSTVNPTEVNSANSNTKHDSLCHVLISSPAVLTLSIALCFPIWNNLEIIKPFIRTRNRILIVTNDLNVTVSILERIRAQNKYLAPTDYSKSATQINRPMSIHNNEPVRRQSELNMLSLTGFLIDCVDHFLIHVEGPSFGVLQEIWHSASFIKPSKVLYDGSLLFNTVSYEHLINDGGFYMISLRQAPADLLKNKNSYKNGNIPLPAYKALMQLHHLSGCSSMARAVQYKLFPDYASLLSLDLEFGVPHMFVHHLH